MEQKDKYIDKSGDKKYFAIIPYYIVNHSTAYEQSLYLVMKRIAGEEGVCWASPEYIAERMKCSPNTVKKYRAILLKRGWIKKNGTMKSGKTNQIVDVYEIIDLWRLNNDYVDKIKKVSNNDTLKVSTGDEKVSPVAYKEETIKKKDIILNTDAEASGKKINDIIFAFKRINPSYKQLFKRNNQRNAVKRLFEKIGVEKLEQIIKTVEKTNTMKYAPTIITPLQLEEKLGSLIAFIKKEQGEIRVIKL